ncbi:GTPase IMAP family member 5 [Patella vulgata]|uniref:GTPase IMAP family member 5 n=1 Tax=Patella vulgata TaxID=6465 RepID=UPI0024A92CF7|nr:GTPase IMAP family member 5 [Patella vulgata]
MPKRTSETILLTCEPSKRIRSLTFKAVRGNSDTDRDPEDSPTTHTQSQPVPSSIGHSENSTHHIAEVHTLQHDTIPDNIHDNNSDINQTIAQANLQSIPVITQADSLQASAVYGHPAENNSELATQHFSGNGDRLAVELIVPPIKADQHQATALTDTTLLPPYVISSVVQSDGSTSVNPMETGSSDRPPCDNRDIELKIVLSGKTGVGKSFLGNSLLRKQLFETRLSLVSITSNCSSGTRTLNDGTIIRVFDTPGFFDTRYKTAELVKHLFSLSYLTAPGPHVFLYVLRADEKLTDENKDSIYFFRDIFGADVNKYVIFVLNRKPKEMDANTLIEECDFLNILFKECHNRYATINFADSDTGVEKCVDNLLQMILNTVRDNDRKHYSSNLFVEAERSYNTQQELNETQKDMKIQLAVQAQEITELKQHQLFLQKKCDTGNTIPLFSTLSELSVLEKDDVASVCTAHNE